MLLVLLAVIVAFIVGMSFLASAATTSGVADTLNTHARAQAAAESGVALAVQYIEQTPDWRTARTSGTWVSDYDMGGALISIAGVFSNDPDAGAIVIDDPSFEEDIGGIANVPPHAPPMTGTVGGWDLKRTSAIETDVTVPHVGVKALAGATDGSRLGAIEFPLVVVGTGTLGQTLPDALVPNAHYVLRVDVGKAELAAVLSDYEIRVFAGGTLVTSSNDSSLLSLLDLGGGFEQHALRFETGSSPPAGPIRIELHAASVVGVISAVAFDNVQLEIEDHNPVVLTVESHLDETSHVVRATVVPDTESTAGYRVVKWEEP